MPTIASHRAIFWAFFATLMATVQGQVPQQPSGLGRHSLSPLGTLYYTQPYESFCTGFFPSDGNTGTRLGGGVGLDETTTVFSTTFFQGCNDSWKSYCCPASFDFSTPGYYSPASGCPSGYTFHGATSFTKLGSDEATQADICCPSVAGPVTSYSYDSDRGICTGPYFESKVGTNSFESYYTAYAIVVVPDGATNDTTALPRECPSRGLAASAIVGIALGAAIPALIGAAYVGYLFGRSRGKLYASEVMQQSNTGGVDTSMAVGGIQSNVRP
ncbi:hypothetical protein TWF481_008374 [Arthrobotrys musiformis]